MKKIIIAIALLFFGLSLQAQMINYVYDNLGRIISISYANGASIAYAYDKVGNRISKISIGSLVPLSYNLVLFTGFLQESNVQLQWKTIKEENSDHFEVQFSESGDSTTFHTFDTEKAAGSSNSPLSYQSLHLHPIIGKNYYRLQMFDTDGTFQFSNVVEVNFGAQEGNMTVYPNPTQGILNITFSQPKEDAHFTIFNSAGMEVSDFQMEGSGSAYVLDVSKLAAGTYELKTNVNLEMPTTKFQVVK